MLRLIAVAALLLAACASPGVSYAPTNPSPRPTMPRPTNEVAVLFTDPACPYVEVGYVETTAPVLRRDWTIPQKIDALRAAAAARGADAVLMVSHSDTSGDHHGGGAVSHSYAGVAITFVAPAAQCSVATTTN